jgi:hypothetical protein
LTTWRVFGLASGAVIFAITVAGCEQKEGRVTAVRSATGAPAGAGDVISTPGGAASPATSPGTGEAKSVGKEQAGETF